MRKRVIAALLAACLLLGLTGCATSAKKGTPKDFTFDKLTITMNSAFSQSNAAENGVYYRSSDVAAVIIKDTFDKLDGITTIQDYVNQVFEANDLDATLDESGEIPFFTYGNTVNKIDFFYYAAVFKGSDAFWLVQFGCDQQDKDVFLPMFEEFAASVRVE